MTVSPAKGETEITPHLCPPRLQHQGLDGPTRTEWFLTQFFKMCDYRPTDRPALAMAPSPRKKREKTPRPPARPPRVAGNNQSAPKYTEVVPCARVCLNKRFFTAGAHRNGSFEPAEHCKMLQKKEKKRADCNGQFRSATVTTTTTSNPTTSYPTDARCYNTYRSKPYANMNSETYVSVNEAPKLAVIIGRTCSRSA